MTGNSISQRATHFALQSEEFRYLGQFFSASLDKILTSNYDPMISASRLGKEQNINYYG